MIRIKIWKPHSVSPQRSRRDTEYERHAKYGFTLGERQKMGCFTGREVETAATDKDGGNCVPPCAPQGGKGIKVCKILCIYEHKIYSYKLLIIK